MEKKFLKKSVSVLMLFVIDFAVFSDGIRLRAAANTDIDYNRKLINGKSIAYRISPEVDYTVSIQNAINKLTRPPASVGKNRLVLKKTDDHNASKMDFYQYRRADRFNGYATKFRKNSNNRYYAVSAAEQEKYDWVYGEIKLNDYYMSKYTNTVKEVIILHEMLHIYGLKNVSNPSSVMYYLTPRATGLTKDANVALNKKY
ncbi:MAG: hypothetical protein ACRCUP_01955 [Mycoplasmatales bacterium]